MQELVDELLKLRGVIGQAVEQARQEKLIGNALEARVILRCDVKKLAGIAPEELEEFFILSDLHLEPAETAFSGDYKNALSKMRALLAPSRGRGEKRELSGFMRPMRIGSRRNRGEQVE